MKWKLPINPLSPENWILRILRSFLNKQLILAAADVIKYRKVTAYPAVGPVLIVVGAHWVQPQTLGSCTVDGNLIPGVNRLSSSCDSDSQVFDLADKYRDSYSDSLSSIVCPFYCSYSIQRQVAMGCSMDS